MSAPAITVFTPVYNRGYCVRNVYESLLRQTFTDFEWLVINDGSTDDTASVIRGCMDENRIRIRYVEKPNGGKHLAINTAIEMSAAPLLMIVDSDDSLTDDALEWIGYYESTIHGQSRFCGVSGLRFYHNGAVIGSPWPDSSKPYLDMVNTNRYKKRMLLGDKAEAYYTEVLRQFAPMPAFPGETFLGEGWLWNRIARAGYAIRWFNRPIYRCEYLNDGLTRHITENYLKNFMGYTAYVKEFIRCDIGLANKIKTTIVYCELARRKGYSPLRTAKALQLAPPLVLPAYLLSYLTPVRFALRCLAGKRTQP